MPHPPDSPDVWPLYETSAAAFDRDRNRDAGEAVYLRKVAARLPEGGQVLDLGCGMGEPIARFFIERGHHVTGVDAAPAMLAICRARFPDETWIVADMRRLALGTRFDAIVAWDSFFHLSREAQRAMFALFGDHTAPGAALLFTSGPADGEAIGDLYGQALFHASLDPQEYRALLAENGFDVVVHRVEDPECGGHTVWLAEKRP